MHAIFTIMLLFFLIDEAITPATSQEKSSAVTKPSFGNDYPGTSDLDTKPSTYYKLNITKVEDIDDCKLWSNTIVENDTLCLEGTFDFTNTLKTFTRAVHVKINDSFDKNIFSDMIGFEKCEEKLPNNFGCHCQAIKVDTYKLFCKISVERKYSNAVIQAFMTHLNESIIESNTLYVPAFKHIDSSTNNQPCEKCECSEGFWKRIAILFICISVLLAVFIILILISQKKKSKQRANTQDLKSKQMATGGSDHYDEELNNLVDKRENQKGRPLAQSILLKDFSHHGEHHG